MPIYANYLRFTGADSPQLVLKAVGGWIKEQLGYGLHPDQLRAGGKTFSANDQASHPGAWVRVHAAKDSTTEICAWELKHPDESVSGRQWVTDVGFRSNATGCELSCVVQNDGMSPLVPGTDTASQPRVITYAAHNIENARRRGAAADFAPEVPGLGTWSVGADDDSYRMLANDIHRVDRNYPIVLVSPLEGKYLVNPRELQRKLLGLGQVFLVAPGFNSYAMVEAVGREYAAWDGAVNVIDMPFKSGLVRYRLFRRAEIDAWGPPKSQINQILTQVAHNTNVPRLRGQVRPEAVMQANHRQWTDRTQAELARVMAEMRRRVDAGQASQAQLTAEWEKIAEQFNEQSSEQKIWVGELERENERLEAQLQTEREISAELRKKSAEADFRVGQLQAAIKSKLASDVDGEPFDAAALFLLGLVCTGASPTPVECLDSIQATYPEHCLVLETARVAAAKLAHFENGRRLLDGLRRLVTDYRAAYLEGGDSKARGIFSAKEYSAHESETVEKTKRLCALRTFDYDGRPTLMLQHLKVGIEADTSKTIRVHFCIDQETDRVIIGYCGEHLPVSGH